MEIAIPLVAEVATGKLHPLVHPSRNSRIRRRRTNSSQTFNRPVRAGLEVFAVLEVVVRDRCIEVVRLNVRAN